MLSRRIITSIKVVPGGLQIDSATFEVSSALEMSLTDNPSEFVPFAKSEEATPQAGSWRDQPPLL